MIWRELRNLPLAAEHRGRIDRRHAETSLTRPRQPLIVSLDDSDDREVMALARSHRLTTYDAIYLALAIREDCALASLDRRINEAAAAEGVPTFT